MERKGGFRAALFLSYNEAVKICRVLDEEDLAAWREELARCLASDWPGQSVYPPGEPSADVAASHIAPHIAADRWLIRAIAVWTEGGALWANVGDDVLAAGRLVCHEHVLRFRKRGVAMALREEAARLARQQGARDYYAYITYHAAHEKAIVRAWDIMEEWGARPYAGMYRLAL